MGMDLSKLSRLLLFCVAIVGVLTGYTYAQEETTKFPTRPITFIVPFSAGGSADVGFRLLGKEAEKYLGQPVVIVNKAGAGGTIGISAIASAKPDGYTIGHSPGQVLFVMSQLEKLPYHPLKDLTYIMQFVDIYFAVYVKGDSPFKSFEDLMAYGRKNPKKLVYGTNAPLSTAHVIMESVTKKEGVQATHIPFRSSPEIQTAVMGGHIGSGVCDFQHSLVEAGEIRLLAFLGEKRSAEYPQVPILKDFGYDYPCPSMLAVTGPKGMPPEIVKKLEGALSKAMKGPAVIKGIKELHLSMMYRNSEDFERYAVNTYNSFSTLLKEMGFLK
jgi:tripartite-type tricarboxylate transporter receptor subunit TctC